MFKNLKIGAKLILIGGLLIVLPILVIAYFAITEAGDGIKQLEREQLEARTGEIAEGIDNVLKVEMKMANELAVGNATVEAFSRIDREMGSRLKRKNWPHWRGNW